MSKSKRIQNFIEKHLDEQLTYKQIKQLKRIQRKSAKYNTQVTSTNESRLFGEKFKWNSFFRYAITAVASIILCLSIVLPLKLGNASTDKPSDNTSTDGPKRYIENIQKIQKVPSSYSALSDFDNLLLFGQEQHFPFPAIQFGTAYMEISVSDNQLLSYTIINSIVMIDCNYENTLEIFDINYRIRTYKYYSFENYYRNNYATIEKAYDEGKNSITDEIKAINNVAVIEDPDISPIDLPPIIVNGFIIDEIIVFTRIFNDTAFIYFNYNGNEYFIEATKKVFKTADQYEFDAQYIKDKFMPALLQNI